jgi:ribosomal protein S18 acetylase RimI-like enzyme
MPNPLFQVRGAEARDANELLDLDIKCFDDAWSAEEWSRVGHSTEHAISVATYYGNLVGAGVFRQDPDSFDVEIAKLAVLKTHRRKGISWNLIQAAVAYAQNRGAANLYIIVREDAIYPGPETLLPWLKATGFVGTKPFLKRHFTDCGNDQDGVKFVLPLRSTK